MDLNKFRIPVCEYWEGEDGKWYFHLKNGSGEIQTPSQGYTTKWSAIRGAKQARRNWRIAPIVARRL